MVPLPQPVGAAALRTVLDLLAHPFPKVRRLTAERLFSALMVYEDLFRPGEASAGAEGGADIGFWGCDVDTACVALTSTAWHGDDVAASAARDGLYLSLGLPMPDARMGAAREGGGRWGYPDDDVDDGSRDTEGMDSYMSLVQEVGY